MKKLLRVKEVAEKFSVSESTIWRWVVLGIFPKPRKLGIKVTVWEADKLDEYIANS